MNNNNLFRQALQRQNERAAGMKMPDDMEQRVMKSLTPNPSPRRGEPSPMPLRRSPLFWRRIGGGCIAVAASVLLLIMLNIGKQQPEQPPVTADVVTVPQDSTEETQATVPAEVIEQHVVAQAEKPQPAKKRRKVHKPILEEPAHQEAEPEQENIYQPKQPDLYMMAVADAQDIRSRGERLYQEVAQMINNH